MTSGGASKAAMIVNKGKRGIPHLLQNDAIDAVSRQTGDHHAQRTDLK